MIATWFILVVLLAADGEPKDYAVIFAGSEESCRKALPNVRRLAERDAPARDAEKAAVDCYPLTSAPEPKPTGDPKTERAS